MAIESTVKTICKECDKIFKTPRVPLHVGFVKQTCDECDRPNVKLAKVNKEIEELKLKALKEEGITFEDNVRTDTQEDKEKIPKKKVTKKKTKKKSTKKAKK